MVNGFGKGKMQREVSRTRVKKEKSAGVGLGLAALAQVGGSAGGRAKRPPRHAAILAIFGVQPNRQFASQG
jgi:hypothetical protein